MDPFDPNLWTAQEDAQGEVAKKKVVVAARWKIALFFAILVIAASVLLDFARR